MDFITILANALKICGEHADDPFLLYCVLCDCVGNDYALSPQIEMFHKFNKTYRLVLEMKKNPEPKMIGHTRYLFIFTGQAMSPKNKRNKFSNVSSKTFLNPSKRGLFCQSLKRRERKRLARLIIL